MADMAMAFDWTSIALGLAGAAVPLLAVCWQLQRRLAAQLDASRDEISDLSQANAAKQADLAAVRREVELLQIDRDNARDAAHAWNLDRSAKEAELRRLDALSAALRAELREQQEAI